MNRARSDEAVQRHRVLSHHLYELRHGLRHLALFTTDEDFRQAAIERLEHYGIPWLIQPAVPGSRKINIFFGQQVCLEVLRTFGAASLSDLTAEQDFMLGVMLGYDRRQQCERYLQRFARHGRSAGRRTITETNCGEPGRSPDGREDFRGARPATCRR